MKKIKILLTVVALALLASLNAGADQKTITVTGVVVDENGAPMAGVTVYDAKDPGTGTMTNDKGQYSLIIPKECKMLTFDMVGYKQQTLWLKEAALVNMELAPETLDDVVITGIYTRKAESFTGAVHSVSGEELKMVSSHNVLEALKTIDPSLLMVENLVDGSNPNVMASYQLRGASSFDMGTTGLKSNFVSEANTPLFILDGFETSLEKVVDMDMNRVQSITILKDASAKAIYGAKGGNGVIVIETKSLDSSDASITYNGQVSLEMPDLTSYTLCDALQKLEVERRENFYIPTTGTSSDLVNAQNDYYDRLLKATEGESTYWLSKPLRTGVTNKHSVQIELGNKSLKTFTNFSYNKTEGAMQGSDREVITGDINLSYRYKWIVFRDIMSISSMKSNESNYGSFSTYAKMNPYMNPYDENGNLLKELEYGIPSYGGSTIGNPLYDATLNTTNSSNYLDFTNNFYVEVTPIKELKLVGRFGIETKTTGADVFKPAEHSDFRNYTEDQMLQRGSYDQTKGSYLYYDGDVSAQFNKKFEDKHDVFATAQWTISETKFNEVTYYTTGFPNSRMADPTYARQYSETQLPTGGSGLNRNLGLLLTVGYSYDNRYMMDATVKGSASSVFGTNNKWGTFWSAGLAWNLHNEKWLKNTKWLEQLKIRGSVGSSGNQNYASNSSLPIYQYSNSDFYNGFTGVTLYNMENPNLGWEEKMDYNVGLDFRSKHVTAIVDLYIADTKNLVFNRTILPSTGFSSVSDNMGQVRNQGIEASLTYKIFQKNNNYVSVFGKVAVNDNRILKISDELRAYNEQQIALAAQSGSEEPIIQYYDGAPLNSIWVVRSLGVNPTDGKEIYVDKNGNMTRNWSATNLYNAGSSDPLYNGNFGVNGEFYGFGFNVILSYYGGGYRYNSTLVEKLENADITWNVDQRIFTDRWYYPGQVTPYRSGSTVATQATDRFVQHNNVMTLSTATIYYEFPRKLLKPIHLQRLRFSILGNDLYTWSSILIERGTSYPYARTVSFQLTATF